MLYIEVTSLSDKYPPLLLLGMFSPTETRIADLLLEGHDCASAARELGITNHSVKLHLGRMYVKAGLVTGCKQVKLAMLLSGQKVEA
jgi:DNA-binding CsgD family transcriptional regulator